MAQCTDQSLCVSFLLLFDLSFSCSTQSNTGAEVEEQKATINDLSSSLETVVKENEQYSTVQAEHDVTHQQLLEELKETRISLKEAKTETTNTIESCEQRLAVHENQAQWCVVFCFVFLGCALVVAEDVDGCY